MEQPNLQAVRKRNREDDNRINSGIAPVFGQAAKSRKGRAASSFDTVSEESLGVSLENIPTDTEVTVSFFVHKFPSSANTLPFVLKSQIYSVLKDRTLVDRELDELCRLGKLRVFNVTTRHDDYAILQYSEYKKHIQSLCEANPEWATVFEAFEKLLKGTTDMTISLSCLEKHIMSDRPLNSIVTKLVTSGLLLQDQIDPSSFRTAIPGIGRVLSGVVKGRKEILDIISRSKYHELFKKDLLKRRSLRSSKLPMEFLIADMIGSNLVECVKSPVGDVLRVK
mmetsp:Transcript_33826/g.54816  ORF Transcript_33826/g.54816 Transcript_33826/m.54816 type:complete len:281 (-) Transcript_33826:128-970(-)|eukprot:CAMPEP_0184651932 /NCGR_PEP_ID=MMETSP0308-20130426/9593_1 /TAXON_ID=38269 /ORGANISM="Gloeochaete witrockiana, Strain SAG 46.84" /LENGTH=280 /DNA_ID=CAMNT_0027086495 /DNA_START=92 /DNA_END=934 /DNA_ORIENTATION=-